MIHKYIDRIKLAKVIKSEIYLLLFSFENKTKKDPTNGKKINDESIGKFIIL
tara:strand:- start:209 stop:364 length:156 start_codon:yes stop_codon:yes gene_type:complete